MAAGHGSASARINGPRLSVELHVPVVPINIAGASKVVAREDVSSQFKKAVWDLQSLKLNKGPVSSVGPSRPSYFAAA